MYKIKKGAPYGVSCPGSIVELHSYHEDGSVSVIVKSRSKLAEAIRHEIKLGKKYQKNKSQMHNIHHADVQVNINPDWLESIH